MKTYMIHTIKGKYCVFSTTRMNNTSKSSETDALDHFYNGRTFDPSDPHNCQYELDTTGTKVLQLYSSHTNGVFGTVLYEILSSSDTSTYEYW